MATMDFTTKPLTLDGKMSGFSAQGAESPPDRGFLLSAQEVLDDNELFGRGPLLM